MAPKSTAVVVSWWCVLAQLFWCCQSFNFITSCYVCIVSPNKHIRLMQSIAWTRRFWQHGISAVISGASPNDVVYERGHAIAHRAPAPQSAALQTEEETPDHLHRRAARGPGEPFPRNQVPGRWNARTVSAQSPSTRGESGGELYGYQLIGNQTVPIHGFRIMIVRKLSDIASKENKRDWTITQIAIHLVDSGEYRKAGQTSQIMY